MPLIRDKPFERQHLEKKQDVITVWLNKEEREILDNTKMIIEQPKDGTAIKQMALVGAKLLGSDLQSYLLGVIYSNKRKNKRLGIVEFE